MPRKRPFDHRVVLQRARVLAHLGTRRRAPVRRLDVPRVLVQHPVRVSLRLWVLFQLEPRRRSVGSKRERHLLVRDRGGALDAGRVEGLGAIHVPALERVVRLSLELIRVPLIRVGDRLVSGFLFRGFLFLFGSLVAGIVGILLDRDASPRLGLHQRRARGRGRDGRRHRLDGRRRRRLLFDLFDDHRPGPRRSQRTASPLVVESPAFRQELVVAGL